MYKHNAFLTNANANRKLNFCTPLDPFHPPAVPDIVALSLLPVAVETALTAELTARPAASVTASSVPIVAVRALSAVVSIGIGVRAVLLMIGGRVLFRRAHHNNLNT